VEAAPPATVAIMTLATQTKGSGRRLVLAHGFTQNRDCWGPFGDDLATDHEVVAVDLPGHGSTPPAHDAADLPTAADLLVDAGGPATYIGYSMGGRVVLHAALRHPAAVTAVVLIGATAGIDDPAGRQARRDADDALAGELVDGGLEPFLDRWLAGPLFAGLDDDAACRHARLANRVEGLAASLRHCGTGTQAPLWDRLPTMQTPTLVLVGGDDAKFTKLGTRLVEALPAATMRVIAGTHAVHLEQPDRAAAAVRAFVNRA